MTRGLEKTKRVTIKIWKPTLSRNSAINIRMSFKFL